MADNHVFSIINVPLQPISGYAVSNMRVFRDIASIRQHLQSYKDRSQTIGLVPTMGALHNGHLSLVRRSIEENDVTVCSIYVNPTQFNNPDDLARYPRIEDQDLGMLEAEGCQIVFHPGDADMFPVDPALYIGMDYLDGVLEGHYRPGHFKGVRLIVAKLLNITNPDRAYFGKKDLQQLVVIRQMAKALDYATIIIGVDTVREEDGLAMSSRNLLLSPEQRKQAPCLYNRLLFAQERFMQGQTADEIKAEVYRYFEDIEQIRLEYFEFVDANSFKPVDNKNSSNHVSICVAAYVGNIRLIDNISV
jgi:pantoate--beta-alanine ligase